MSNRILGYISEKYESSGNPSAISKSKEDFGNRFGGSYGAYQMIVSTVKRYLDFIKIKYSLIYNILIKHPIASVEFDNDWKYVGSNYIQQFKESQWAFIKSKYYDVIVNKIKIKYGFDINKRSFALQNVIWSLVVQHGVGNKIFDVVYKPGITDKDLIIALYAERGANNGKKYFSKSSIGVQKAVCNRFKNELNDALNLLNEDKQPVKEVDNVNAKETELVRALAIIIERLATNQPIVEQVNYVKIKFDEYLKIK